METEPRLPSCLLTRSISARTSCMNAARSLLTPLLLASTASALRRTRGVSRAGAGGGMQARAQVASQTQCGCAA
jgi:hypothetical protein